MAERGLPMAAVEVRCVQGLAALGLEEQFGRDVDAVLDCAGGDCVECAADAVEDWDGAAAGLAFRPFEDGTLAHVSDDMVRVLQGSAARESPALLNLQRQLNRVTPWHVRIRIKLNEQSSVTRVGSSRWLELHTSSSHYEDEPSEVLRFHRLHGDTPVLPVQRDDAPLAI